MGGSSSFTWQVSEAVVRLHVSVGGSGGDGMLPPALVSRSCCPCCLGHSCVAAAALPRAGAAAGEPRWHRGGFSLSSICSETCQLTVFLGEKQKY